MWQFASTFLFGSPQFISNFVVIFENKWLTACHGKLRADLVIIEGQCTNYGLSHKMTSKMASKLKKSFAPLVLKKENFFKSSWGKLQLWVLTVNFLLTHCPHHDDKVFLAEKTLLFGISMVYIVSKYVYLRFFWSPTEEES